MKKIIFLFLSLTTIFSCQNYLQNTTETDGEVKIVFEFPTSKANFNIKAVPQNTGFIEVKIFGERLPLKEAKIIEIKKPDIQGEPKQAKAEAKKIPIGEKYVEIRAYENEKKEKVLASAREKTIVRPSQVVRVVAELKEGDLPELKDDKILDKNAKEAIKDNKKLQPCPPEDPNQKEKTKTVELNNKLISTTITTTIDKKVNNPTPCEPIKPSAIGSLKPPQNNPLSSNCQQLLNQNPKPSVIPVECKPNILQPSNQPVGSNLPITPNQTIASVLPLLSAECKQLLTQIPRPSVIPVECRPNILQSPSPSPTVSSSTAAINSSPSPVVSSPIISSTPNPSPTVSNTPRPILTLLECAQLKNRIPPPLILPQECR
ncbi:MAG: hypothetical protein U0457_13715 [Candidatus Sericytochromatia bacterium]